MKPAFTYLNFALFCNILAETSVNYKWNLLKILIQSLQRSLNLLFQCTFFLIFPHFQKYLNPQVRTKKLVNNVFYHPCPSRLASQGYISGIHLLRLLSLQNACWIFCDLYMPTFVGKIFNLWCHIPRKSLNRCFFTHAPVPPNQNSW